MLTTIFQSLDPVAFSIGPIVVRWYALAYIFGIALGYFYLRSLARKEFAKELKYNKKFYDDAIFYLTLGIVLGGRIGYVLIYNLPYYMENWHEIFAIWRGGMSFHGGVVGVVVVSYLLCKKRDQSFLRFMDLVTCSAPIGLFFGRLANFVNGELYGRVSDVAWAIVFPGGGALPRHPSQLYEALLEGLVLFILMRVLVFNQLIKKIKGALSCCFIMLYSILRFVVEFTREPDVNIGYFLGWLTIGQILSVFLLVIAMMVLILLNKLEKDR